VRIEYFLFGLAVQPVKLFLIPQDFTHFFANILVYLTQAQTLHCVSHHFLASTNILVLILSVYRGPRSEGELRGSRG